MPDRSASAIPDNPDHEFEIILGNKQLFSLLFIVFVLLGVFFAMGYLMGRNTLPVDTAATGRKSPPVADFGPRAPAGGSDSPGETPVATPPASSSGSFATAPEPERERAPRTAGPDAKAAGPDAKADPKKGSDEPPSSFTIVEPKPGQTFMQVTAITKAEAELFVEVLNKRGFRALLAPSPKENIFRVLVGPAKDEEDLGKLRTQLEQSGFKPIPRRY